MNVAFSAVIFHVMSTLSLSSRLKEISILRSFEGKKLILDFKNPQVYLPHSFNNVSG